MNIPLPSAEPPQILAAPNQRNQPFGRQTIVNRFGNKGFRNGQPIFWLPAHPLPPVGTHVLLDFRQLDHLYKLSLLFGERIRDFFQPWEKRVLDRLPNFEEMSHRLSLAPFFLRYEATISQ